MDKARAQHLVRLLVGMTVVTGLVDAVSYLALGRVFVANMTGNVVFLGFAWAGDASLSAAASLLALAAFLLGALAGGELAARSGAHRGASPGRGARRRRCRSPALRRGQPVRTGRPAGHRDGPAERDRPCARRPRRHDHR